MEICISKADTLPDICYTDWPEITSWLRTEFLAKASDDELLEPLVEWLFNIIDRTLNKFMWYNCLEAEIFETLTETLKALRLIVTNANVADYIAKQSKYFDALNTLSVCLFTKKNGSELFTKYLLQFFLNLLSVGNIEQKMHIRHIMREHELVDSIHDFFLSEWGYSYEISAVIYNLYYDEELKHPSIMTEIIRRHTKETFNEYLDFLMEKIISENSIWEYFKDCTYQRPNFLKILKCILMNTETEHMLIKVNQLPESCIKCLAYIFNYYAGVVFQITKDNLTEAEEVSSVLELLAHLSSNEKYLIYLQNNKDILINAGVLLINLHRLGKAPSNIFSPVQKLAELSNPSDDIQSNPVFGFKADLVRLIGNLCWKNKRMQDLAREGELIPILLDSCNMDAKNPFIIQWVILAIRNMCEKNQENQAVIASLKQQGVIDSEVLQEFGLTLHSEDDLSIGIVRLDLNK